MEGYIIGRRVKLIFYFEINYIGGWAMKNLSNEYNSQFECLKKEKASINKNLNPDVLQSYKALMIFFICLTLIITNFSLAVSANRILGTPIEEPGEKRDVNEGKSSGGREVKSDKEDLDSDLESITKIGNIEDDESKDSKDVISIIDSVKNTLLNVLGGEQGLSEYWDDNRPILLYEWAFQERFIESPTDPKGREQQNNPIYRLADNAKSVEHGITSSGTTRFNANDYLNRIREAGIEAGGRLALKMQDDGTWGDVYRAFNHWYPKSYNEIRKVLAEFEKAANALRLSPPTNLRAIEVNDTSVRLRWTPPSNTSNVKEYWVILNGQQRIRYNGTTGTIRGLKPDTEYSFYAYSVDSNENLSQRSNRITVRTKKLEPPTNLIATEITHTTANLSWTGSKSETVTGYQVWYREEDAENFSRAATVRGTNYRLEGLNPSGVYAIYVRAVDENGNRSNRSNAIGISPVIENPLPPTNLKATEITDTTISLTWSPSRSSTVKGYQVWYREQGVGNYSRAGTVDERVFTLENLDPLTTYEVYVRAIVNSDIRSDRSNLLPVTTDRKEILPPENLRITETRRGSMNIEWDPSPSNDVKEYWVYRNGVKRDEVSNTSARVTGISGTEYEIYVKAVDSDGNVSDKSNIVTGKTTGPRPVRNLKVTDITSDSVSLRWDISPSDDVSVYRIYKDGEPIKTITPLNPSFTIGLPQIRAKIGNLENGTQYEFYIRAVDREGDLSTWSNRVNPTTLGGLWRDSDAKLDWGQKQEIARMSLIYKVARENNNRELMEIAKKRADNARKNFPGRSKAGIRAGDEEHVYLGVQDILEEMQKAYDAGSCDVYIRMLRDLLVLTEEASWMKGSNMFYEKLMETAWEEDPVTQKEIDNLTYALAESYEDLDSRLRDARGRKRGEMMEKFVAGLAAGTIVLVGGYPLIAGAAKKTLIPTAVAAYNAVSNTIVNIKNKVGPHINRFWDWVTKGAGKTGTVWDKIKATQEVYPNTKIPKSFEIATKNGDFWVHPNATKHMAEYITKSTTHGIPMNSQSLLTGFQESVSAAIKQGIKFEAPMKVGNWELIFSNPKAEGLLPVIKHAVYLP